MSKTSLTPTQKVAFLKGIIEVVRDWLPEENSKSDIEAKSNISGISAERLKKWRNFMKQY